MNRATLAYCLAVCLSAAGCASGSSAEEETPPAVEALQASHRQVRRSVEDAHEESESLNTYTVRARYNPPRCPAPAFEVRAHGRWTRIYVQGDAEIQKKLEALKPDEEAIVGREAIVQFRGRWRGTREAETGLEYRMFRVIEIVD